MTFHLGFREIPLNFPYITNWRQITIDTGATLSTLQDIKLPEYGGSYMYKRLAPNTQNRYIFWRVCHDIVEIWEESLDNNFDCNHLQLKFADSPVLEGLSVHETSKHIVILLATVASIHHFKFPHPLSNCNELHNFSIFRDVNFHSLRDFHHHYVISGNSLAGDTLPHTASTHMLSSTIGNGDGLFALGFNGGSLLLATMTNVPNSVHFSKFKTASLFNRIITGFVPTVFRGMEGAETVSSLALCPYKGETLAFGICLDGRLRAWSCARLEPVLAYSVLENTAEAGKKFLPGAQRHLIRTCLSGEILQLAVFLSFEQKQMTLIFTPQFNLGQLTLHLIKTVYCPQYDLIDMIITPAYLWSLWTDSKNETKLLYSSVNFNTGLIDSPGLKEAFLEPLPEKDVALSDPLVDPSESFLQELFTPNRFSALTLQKTLNIYRRTLDASKSSSTDDIQSTGLWKLFEDVEETLKEEIQLQMDADVTQEEAAEMKANAWATFYSHALQYHQVAQKPVSIIGIGGGGLAGIMRKQSVSWMRPMDALEFLIVGEVSSSSVVALSSTPILNEDSSVAAAVVSISQPLKAIGHALYPEVVTAFSFDLYHRELPEQVAAGIAASLLSGNYSTDMDEPLSKTIMNQMNGVPGVIAGFQAYIKALELDLGNPDALTLDFETNFKNSSNGAFCSRLGCSILSKVVAQLAEHRLNLCRDLLLLQQILMQLDVLSPDTKNKIYTTILPQTTRLTQAYFALAKLSVAVSTIPTPFNIETTRRQMASLSVNENGSLSLPSPTHFPVTSLELFVVTCGGSHARSLVTASLEEESSNGWSWAQLLMPLATTVAQLTWPISKCLLFVEFLVWGNQHEVAQEYIRLLQPWCEWNSCSRKFLLGVSFLNEGGARKAHHMFLAASEGVASEEFLRKIVGAVDDMSMSEIQIQYCLKVVHLLEQSGHVSLALEMALVGVTLAEVDDPGLAALYSVSFKYHLELEHHDEAFTSLMANPDPNRRKNCLRQLITTLYDRKCLSSLVSYNYGALEQDVIAILEKRARSADILVNNYYDLLFAFHISKHNYRKAAWVMYECALRLNKEGVGEKGLHQQAKCFLACINCLSHIPRDEAWITKQVATSSPESAPMDCEDDEGGTDRLSGSRKTLKQILRAKKPEQIRVIEIGDIEREFELVHARLKLFKVHSSAVPQLPPGGPMNASDTISLLIHGKLFREALHISHLFELNPEQVIEGLTLTCIEADMSEDKGAHWMWLSENGIQKDSCEEAAWWSLLRQILTEEESGKQSHLHKVAATVLLQRGRCLPAWLYDSYKRRNCGEFISLYLKEGILEEATRLSMSLVDALLGVGTKQMNLEHALHANSPAVWFPYNAVDHLLLELKELKATAPYDKLHQSLMGKMEQYKEELQRVSYARFLMAGH